MRNKQLTLSTPAPTRVVPSFCMLPQQYIYVFFRVVPGTKTFQQSLICTTPFPQTTGTPSPTHRSTRCSSLPRGVTCKQQLEQQRGHLLPGTAGGHRRHHLLPSPLSWCCRALGTEMHRGKRWRTAILGRGSSLLGLTF